MKTTENNKALVYDDNCPLCKAYTAAFVKGGLLKAKNRIAFSHVNIQQFHLEWKKARNEIPLIDLKTGEVKYGVDALTDILQQKFPLIKSIMKIKWLNWFFRKLYKLVSYNRKIIVASVTVTRALDCAPDYSFFWRWVLIIFCYTISNYFIIKSTSLLCDYKIFTLPGLVIFWMIISVASRMVASKKTATEIHAHASITATITCFFLFIGACCVKFFNLPFWLASCLFLFIVMVTVKQIKRRCLFIRDYNNTETQTTSVL